MLQMERYTLNYQLFKRNNMKKYLSLVMIGLRELILQIAIINLPYLMDIVQRKVVASIRKIFCTIGV